jgi:hypothetical protein
MLRLKKIFRTFKKLFTRPKIKNRKRKLSKRTSKRPPKKVIKKIKPKKNSKKSVKVKKLSSAAKKKERSAVIPKSPIIPEPLVGQITHYFPRIQVAVLKMMKEPIRITDKIHIVGLETNFIQEVKSLQIESVNVTKAKKGQLVGLKVDKEVKVKDKVFRMGSSKPR